MLKLMQHFTVGLGCCSAAMSFGLFLWFARSRRPLGKAVAAMLCGEFIMSACAIVFSVGSQGIWDGHIDVTEAMLLRLLMFTVASGTSIHLAYQVSRVLEEQEEEG